MQMKKLASIEIGNRSFYIAPVLAFLDGIAENHTNLDPERYHNMRYVVEAVLKKRIAKAYPGGEGTLCVELLLSDPYFEVSIKDKGVPAWTDFSYDEDRIAYEEQDKRNFILDQLVDGIGIEQLGKDGQKIYIRQRIHHEIKFQKPEPYRPMEVLDTNITIRPVVTRADAIEAIRCIYSEYGYSYCYEKLYYVDSFMNMLQNGELMSFLAVNEHGQTAGHFALSFSDTFRNMPEITTVVTRKEFRGLGLFSMFMDHCMTLGEQHGFRAFMGQPVGYHTMSQKAFLRSGFTPTAVLLSYVDSTIESEYNKDGQRLDLFACVKVLDKDAHTTVYPPAEICAFADNVFAQLGSAYELCREERLQGSTRFSIEYSNSLKMTKVLMEGAGEDLQQILQETVKDSVRRKNEVIELLISMNDPSCGYCYETAKKCGFVFSGLIPGSARGDHIVMQMLPGTDPCYDRLVTVGAFEALTRDVIARNQE